MLTSYTAALDWLSDWDSEDFEDSEDEYDNFSKLNRQRTGQENGKDEKVRGAQHSKARTSAKSRRTSLRQPVLWKSWHERLPSPEVPIWKDGQHPKLSLLKDWRQRTGTGVEPSKVAKASKSKGKGKSGRKATNIKPPPAREPSLDEEEAFLDDIDPAKSELPPTILHAGDDPQPKKPLKHGYLNGTTSSMARQAITQASNVEEAAGTQSRKRKASEPPDTNGSVHHPFKAKRGRPTKNVQKNGDTDAATVEPSPKGDQVGKGQAPQKSTRGRPKGSSAAPKVASTVASTRSTRNKNR